MRKSSSHGFLAERTADVFFEQLQLQQAYRRNSVIWILKK